MEKFILASQSPRRLEMLSKYNLDLSVVHSNIEEKVQNNEKPETIVMSLAFQKALDVSNRCNANSIVIAADTIVYLDKVLGKPNNLEDGYRMLKILSGKTHYVYSGICLIQAANNKKIIDYEVTEVTFKQLSDDVIKAYLATNEYADKAGAYGIQGFGELLVYKINGCYNNVKGLPINKLNELLIRHFDFNLLIGQL